MAKRTMKPNKTSIKNITGSAIVILFMIIMLIGVVDSYFDADLKQSDLVKFEGKITSYEEKSIGGSRSHQVRFLKLNNTNITFKISNNSYRVLNLSHAEKYLKEGETVVIGTTIEELEKAKNSGLFNKILNLSIDTRINPQTYFLNHRNQQLFDIDKYNEYEYSRKKSNVIWGIPTTLIAVLIFGLNIYANWKDRFKKG